jgi:hypothetical protein
MLEGGLLIDLVLSTLLFLLLVFFSAHSTFNHFPLTTPH